MSKNKKRTNAEFVAKRRQVGILVTLILIVSLVIIFIGYKLWLTYNNSPEKIAARFIDAFTEYRSTDMQRYTTQSFWKENGGYYEAVSHALGVLADNIAKDKGLPKAMLKPQLKMEVPPISEWRLVKTSTFYVFSYDGPITITFPESQTLSNSRVDVKVDFVLRVCKEKNGWKVCDFKRQRKYASWTAYEFLEARMAANTNHLESMLCSKADESIKDYIDAYDIMVHDPAGDSNYAWIVSHIATLNIKGDRAYISYGLYKVSSQDPTKPILKWKYVDVREHLLMCKENGVWYIKGIYFEN